METKVKRSSGPKAGRMRQRLDAQQLVTNPIMKALLKEEYPPHFVILWLRFFAKCGVDAIMPSDEKLQKRMDMSHYRITVSMMRLMGYGLAEELDTIKKQSGAGRPAKRYRLIIPG